MAMTIKTSPELWGEDARIFAEEAERNGKLPTPKLSTRVRDNDIQLGDITFRHELSGGQSLVA